MNEEQRSIDTVVSEIILDSFFKAEHLIAEERFNDAKTYINLMEQDIFKYRNEISNDIVRVSNALYDDITKHYNSEYMIHMCSELTD